MSVSDNQDEAEDSVWRGYPLQIQTTLRDGTHVKVSLDSTEASHLYALLRDSHEARGIRRLAEIIKFPPEKSYYLIADESGQDEQYYIDLSSHNHSHITRWNLDELTVEATLPSSSKQRFVARAELLRRQILAQQQAANAQRDAARITEDMSLCIRRNAKYLLWSIIALTASSVLSFITIILKF